MKEIKKPAFMQEATKGKRGNAAFIEVLIAGLVFTVSGIAMGIVQLPAFIVYLFGNEEYMKQLMSGENVSTVKALEEVIQLPDWLVIVSLFSEIMMIVVVILYCRLIEKRKVSTMGFRKDGIVRQYLLGVMGALLIFSGAYVICVLPGGIQFKGLAENMVPGYIIAYLLGYMLQGMAEEVLCRGYLFVSLSRRYSVVYSAVISSVFFALLHGMNAGLTLLALINLFLYAMLAAFLFVKYESIWMVGAFHSLWNFAQGNLYGIQVSGMGVQNSIFASSMNEKMSFLNGGAFGMEGGLGVSIVLVIAIILILRSLDREGKIVEMQNPSVQTQGYMQPTMGEETEKQDFVGQNPENQNFAEQDPDRQNVKDTEAGVRENMGVRSGETPWRPDNAAQYHTTDISQTEQGTAFDAEYFKD